MLRSPAKSLLVLQFVLVVSALALSFGLASCSRDIHPSALTGPTRVGGGALSPKPPAGLPNLQSLSFFPSTIEGGAPCTGRITCDQITDGVLVTLTSSDPTVLSVPTETVVPGRSQTGDYPITTAPVSAPVTITVSASAFGGATTATGTVTVVPATGPPVPDVVNIKTMTWRAEHLKITATSTNPNAILSAWLTNSDSFMFNLTNDGHGHYSDDRGWNFNPEFITIKSNFLGSQDGTTLK